LSEARSTESEIIDAALICKNRYLDAQIDLNDYHSFASAQDIEALRTALDIEVFSIYAGSYGTRLALTYARDFPDSVSSMVLDSPLPHNAIYDDESPENLKETLKKITDACSNQASCAQAFPNLYARFSKTLTEVALTPWLLETSDGNREAITDYDLVSLLNIGSLSAIKKVPIIMDAIARKDSKIIASLLSREVRSTDFAWGMRLSVWCSESLPFSRRSKGKDSRSFASLDGAVVLPEVCKAWGVKKRPDSEKLSTISEVPTLIIAGDYDALTPPKWGERAARTLKNSYLVNVPFGRHVETNNWSGDGCAMKIANTFFADEALFLSNPLSATECLRIRQPPEFVVSF
jgi:pimeloyl-ACP methyl ester carboxylesterase